MPDAPTKPADIPRYKRISKDVKTVVLAKILQEQSAPTQTLLQNVYRMVREEFDSAGVLVSFATATAKGSLLLGRCHQPQLHVEA
jgi:hypothetical protein